MKSIKKYDYIIIGSGVAGLHLAFQLSKNTFFDNKTVAIVDPNFETQPNRVLSYWEIGDGIWDNVVHSYWNQLYFKSNKINLTLTLEEYTYKSLDFNDFSSFCLSQVRKKDNFDLLESKVNLVQENNDYVEVVLANSIITANFVFDSRISKDYFIKKNNYPSVNQSFKGWEVEFENPVFDFNSFTMMDYRYQWKHSNSFMYILPRSSKRALLEYTFFAPFTISEVEFDSQIKEYLHIFFANEKYQLNTTEKGEIPMTTYPFRQTNSKRILKIGTAGGWVKASTGYSFKYAESNAKTIINQIQQNSPITGQKQLFRFRFYDKLFIKVLQNQNNKGSLIFEEMYKKININTLFRFLDEKTTIKEDIGILLKLPYMPFLKELFRK